MAETLQTISGTFAEFAGSLTYEQLPAAVKEKAKYAVIDTVGAILFGSATEEGRAVREAIRGIQPGGEALIWGTGQTASVSLAALANGTAAHAREMDDFGKESGHPGAVIVPAALGVGAQFHASGKDVLLSVVLGYEIAERSVEALGGYRAHTKAGWHSTGTCCTFGAAVAAARLMGLDREKMTSSIGLAGSYTGGIWAFIEDGAMSKRLHPGKAAENGIVAAYLAKQGFTGPAALFEAPWGGFLNTYTAGGQTGKVNPRAMTDGLGDNFRILRTGFKPHACCRGIHGSLDAFLHLKNTCNLNAGDIAQIDVITSSHAALQLGNKDIVSFLDAQMSLPYSLAVALLTGETGPTQFADRQRQNPDVLTWCRQINVIGREDIPFGAPSTVRIRLHSGETYERSEPFPLGCAENPMTAEQLQRKFRELASTALTEAAADRLLEQLLNMEEVADVSAIVPLLQGA
jgi:2-methylcitrate dehydratase PrpD